MFYRTNAQSRVLEESLTHGGVPYKVVGGTKFYDRREVKMPWRICALLLNPLDEVCIKRVLNVPKRGMAIPQLQKLTHMPTKQAFHLPLHCVVQLKQEWGQLVCVELTHHAAAR